MHFEKLGDFLAYKLLSGKGSLLQIKRNTVLRAYYIHSLMIVMWGEGRNWSMKIQNRENRKSSFDFWCFRILYHHLKNI